MASLQDQDNFIFVHTDTSKKVGKGDDKRQERRVIGTFVSRRQKKLLEISRTDRLRNSAGPLLAKRLKDMIEIRNRWPSLKEIGADNESNEPSALTDDQILPILLGYLNLIGTVPGGISSIQDQRFHQNISHQRHLFPSIPFQVISPEYQYPGPLSSKVLLQDLMRLVLVDDMVSEAFLAWGEAMNAKVNNGAGTFRYSSVHLGNTVKALRQRLSGDDSQPASDSVLITIQMLHAIAWMALDLKAIGSHVRALNHLSRVREMKPMTFDALMHSKVVGVETCWDTQGDWRHGTLRLNLAFEAPEYPSRPLASDLERCISTFPRRLRGIAMGGKVNIGVIKLLSRTLEDIRCFENKQTTSPEAMDDKWTSVVAAAVELTLQDSATRLEWLILVSLRAYAQCYVWGRVRRAYGQFNVGFQDFCSDAQSKKLYLALEGENDVLAWSGATLISTCLPKTPAWCLGKKMLSCCGHYKLYSNLIDLVREILWDESLTPYLEQQLSI